MKTKSSVHKLKSTGRWRARFTGPDGDLVARIFARKRDAVEWIEVQQLAAGTGNWANPKHGETTFADFANEWAATRDWAPTSRAQFPRALARLKPVLPANVTLAAVSPMTIDRARRELEKSYKPATVELTMRYLTAVMRAAKRERRITIDPTENRSASTSAPTDDAVRREQVPTREEVLAILDGTPAPFRAAVALGASGLRIGEVLGVTADRVVIDAHGTVKVTVDRQVQRIANADHAVARRAGAVEPVRVGRDLYLVPPKRDKTRTITLPNAFAFDVRRAVRDVEAEALLFVGPRTGEGLARQQAYSAFWTPALKAAGFAPDRFTFHALRHWCASSMLSAGVALPAVAAHLGDTQAVVMRVYAHFMRDDLDVPANALDDVLAEARAACGQNAARS